MQILFYWIHTEFGSSYLNHAKKFQFVGTNRLNEEQSPTEV